MAGSQENLRASSSSAESAARAVAIEPGAPSGNSRDNVSTKPPEKARMDPTIIVALIEAIPRLIGVLTIVILAVVVFRKRAELRPFFSRLTSVEALGFKLSMDVMKGNLEAAGTKDKPVAAASASRAVARATQAAASYRGAQILWTDDHPEHNYYEEKVIRELGATVVRALSNAEAEQAMNHHPFDLVISDMGRDEEPDVDGAKPGQQLLDWIRRRYPFPVIFYASTGEAVQGAFASTNRPDELLDYVTDALERQRPFKSRSGE